MKSSSQTGRTGTGRQISDKPGLLTFIGMTIAIISIIVMFILYLIPFSGANKRNPIVVFMGCEGNFPRISMMNTLHRAGFDMLVADETFELDPDNTYIVAGVGDDAFSYMSQYRDAENVAGFVLICPKLPANGSTEGFDSSDPAKDIAIFAGKDDADKVSDLKDARIIFERISGVDTVFGVPITRGGLFASRAFVNVSQNRYLSMSSFTIRDPQHYMFSPLFQNEFAGYLSLTYQSYTIKDASFGGINAWFVLFVASFFAAIAGLSLYFSLLPVVVSDIKQERVPLQEKAAVGIIGGITLGFAIGSVVLSLFESLRRFIPYVLVALPIIFMLVLSAARLKFILSHEDEFRHKSSKIRRPVFMAVSVGLVVLFAALIAGDMSVSAPVSAPMIAAVAFVIDFFLACGLLYADRKSRSIGQGGCSYFGNRIIFLMMLIPAVFSFFFGLISDQNVIMYAGLDGITVTLVPFLSLIPLRRHTDRSLIPALLHGFVFAVTVLLVL
ncbi:hypothetical protein SAMN05216413_0662 [Ruminococcaceae bacterium KH2T8]|nr:hypothetical protein SAMN05216413_0662 [Ruminococcaceae bacterium KH2T8]